MLDGIRKFSLGELINNEFEVIGYRAREKNYPGYPVYLVRHKCGSETTVYHRRQYAAKCEHCIYEALRQGLAQNPTDTARHEAIRNLDAQVEQAHRQPQAPAPVQAPQPTPQPSKKGNFIPSKPLSRTARIVIQDLLVHGWTDEAIRKGGFEDL